MPNVYRIFKPRKSTTSTITDLPSVLASWSQAVHDFHALHGILSDVIANYQQPNVSAYSDATPANQSSLCDLKKVRDMMALEITSLINELDNSGELSPESAPLTINRLRSHTVRLEKEVENIKRALWLSSLGAS